MEYGPGVLEHLRMQMEQVQPKQITQSKVSYSVDKKHNYRLAHKPGGNYP